MYIPGIISLMFIPVLFYFYGNHFLAKKNLRVKEVNMPPKHPEKFPFLSWSIPQRNNIDITLTGNDSLDKIKLDFAHISIREIQARYDTINGIHFILKNSCKYGSLIKILDICEVENVDRYMLKNKDFWIIGNNPPLPPEKRIEPFICGYSYYNRSIETRTSWDLAKEKFPAIWESSYIVIISFILFLGLAIYSIIRTQQASH